MGGKMKALVYTGPKSAEVMDVDLREKKMVKFYLK